jgi:ribosomal protein S1
LGRLEDDKKVHLRERTGESMEKAYEDTLSSISEKEVLMGTVVGMNKKEVVINIGYKSEGVVPTERVPLQARSEDG